MEPSINHPPPQVGRRKIDPAAMKDEHVKVLITDYSAQVAKGHVLSAANRDLFNALLAEWDERRMRRQAGAA